MVRINLIDPKKLTDQHLIAEYVEILMLVGYVKKYPTLGKIPSKYTLGKGHMSFFKNKLKYIKERHEKIKKEMKKRGFKTTKEVKLSQFNKKLIHGWKPSGSDKRIIEKRLISKIKFKPDYYRYYGKKKSAKFLIELIKK